VKWRLQRAFLPAVHIYGVAQALEGEERNSNGQRNLGPRIYGPQAHGVPRFYGEVRVFENNQEAYIQHQTHSKPES